MARNSDHLAGGFETDDTGGVLSGLLAEEEDRRVLWRIGSWGVGAIAAVILAVTANQQSFGWKRDLTASADLNREAQRIQMATRETQNEARRLASAVDTLNGDRDRLYARVTTLEQGLDSVTGTIARQASAVGPSPAAVTSPKIAEPAPAVAAVATVQPAAPASDKPAAAPASQANISSFAKDIAKDIAKDTAKDTAKDAAKTDVARTEIAKLEIAKSELESAKAGAGKADAAKTDLQKADFSKPPAATPTTSLVASKSMMAPPDPAAAKLIEPNKPVSPVISTPIPEVMASAPPTPDEEEAEAATSPNVAIQRTEFGIDLGTANSVGGLRALWRGLQKSKSNAALTALRPIIVIKERNNGLGMQLRLVAGPLNDAGAAARICAALAENSRNCETAIFDGQRLQTNSDDPQPVAARPVPRRRGVTARAVVEEPPKKPETVSTISSMFGRRGQ